MPKEYTLHGVSYRIYTVEIIPPLLRCGFVPDLIFPMRYQYAPLDPYHWEDLVIEKAQGFTTDLIPEWQKRQERPWIRLANLQNLEWSISLDTDTNAEYIPNTIVNQDFKQEHLESGVVSIPTLVSTILTMSQILDLESACVWDTEKVKYPEPRLQKFRVNNREYMTRIGWLSYFGAALVAGLGRERFDRLVTCHQKYEVNGGMMVILTEEPYDAHNPAHRERELQAIRELGLEALIPPRPTFPALLKKRKQE